MNWNLLRHFIFNRRKNRVLLNWTCRRTPGPHYNVRRGDKS